jgi:DNA-binding CsgD family transcriptional regulator
VHRQVAQALAAVGTAPERVAAHLVFAPALEAGRQDATTQGPGEEGAAPAPAEAIAPWVLDWLTGASSRLIHRAPKLAADLLHSVLAQLGDGDPRRDPLETALLTALFLLTQNDEVEHAGQRVLARAADPDRAAEVAWLVAYFMITAERAARAAALLADVQARPGVSGALVARLRALHGHILLVQGRIDQAAEEASAALATPADDPIAPGYAHYVLSLVAYLRRNSAARLEHIAQGLAAGEDSLFSGLRMQLLTHHTNVLADMDHTDEALRSGRQTVVLAERLGVRPFWIRAMLAINYFRAGYWDDALTEVEPVFGEDFGFSELFAHALAALIAGHRGDRAGAAEHLSAVPDTAGWATRAGPHSLHGPMLARAVLAEQASGPDAAIAVLAQCLEPILVEYMPMRHVLLPDLTRLALATGDTALAQAAADSAREEAQREPLAWKQATADHCRGLLHEDVAAVLAAADYASATRRPLDCALALENAAVIAANSGDVELARQRADEAVHQYAALGAQWDISRADARMRVHGIRLARKKRERPAVGWQALTATEKKIADKVAQGLSNPDIAAELFLSRNTVQTHVSHILAKLEAHSRAEIIRSSLAPGDRAVRGARPLSQMGSEARRTSGTEC